MSVRKSKRSLRSGISVRPSIGIFNIGLVVVVMLVMLAALAGCSHGRHYRSLGDDVFSAYTPDSVLKIDPSFEYRGKLELILDGQAESSARVESRLLENYLYVKSGPDASWNMFILELCGSDRKLTAREMYSLITRHFLTEGDPAVLGDVAVIPASDMNPLLLNMTGSNLADVPACFRSTRVLEERGFGRDGQIRGFLIEPVPAGASGCPALTPGAVAGVGRDSVGISGGGFKLVW